MRFISAIFMSALLLVTFGLFAADPQNISSPNPATEAARLNNLGAACMNQQLFEKGLKAFQDAAALDPNLQIARLNQGIALLNLTRVEPAKQLLEEAVKRDPNNPHAWFNLGLLYKNSDNAQAAVDAFYRVTEIDPNDADTWYFLGATYSQLKQYPQAIDAFQHALKLNPLHASAEFGISRAYQQSGDVVHARENLQLFQHITQNKLGSPIGLAYGEQGEYSRVEESPGVAEKVPAAIPVKFVNVTAEAGLVSNPAPTTPNPYKGFPNYLGSGACFLDYDNDGKLDLLVVDNGAQGAMSLYHNLGNGRFEDATKNLGYAANAHGIGCTVGDYDNDGFADIAFTSNWGFGLLHNEKNGTFRSPFGGGIGGGASGRENSAPEKKSADSQSQPPQTPGLSEGSSQLSQLFPALPIGVTFIDYDHDGDLDLYITQSNQVGEPEFKDKTWNERTPPPGRNLLWQNNGNGTFTDVTGVTGLWGNTTSIAAIGTDYNNDRAVDIVLTGGRRGATVFENPREGIFKVKDVWPERGPKSAVGVAVLDFDHDGWMDLAFTHGDSPGLTLWHNNHGKSFEQVDLPETNWVRAYGVAAFDYDNDGWVDLVAVGETKDGKGEVKLFRNLGPDGFKDVTADVGLDKISLKEPRAIITGDYDGDGSTDLLITQNHGPAVLLRNEGGNKNNWLRLALRGLNDNKSAIGTKVEVFAGGNRQKFEIAGSSGYLGQNSPYLTIGLGQAKEADVVRMLWPSGVLQDEIQIASNREQAYTEMDRRGSSCPTLFVWDGKHYELVGDMLGAGVVGHWIGPGQRDIPRPTEYIKVDRNAVREKNGKLSFRFMEPLEEVVYLDQVRLLAVDHPASFDVYPNEYFASGPPYPPFKVVASHDPRPPAGAWDDHGRNVLPDLLAHRYFGDFELLPFHGFTKLHSLELDLGEPYRGGPLWLLLHGEVEYFTATSMFAAYQAGVEGVAPYVEVQGANGKWIRVIDDMGFPAGGARTMTADLTDKLPQGTQRIRISTNLQIYWDNILINRTEQDQNVRLTAVALGRADLGFHGFPLKIENQPPGNVLYVYEKASPTGPYTRPIGTYTRYGDVRPLLTASDDRFVVFGSGDEVALDFDPSKLPALPKGWVRDYFFQASGYEKDMDFYAAEGSTVDPLPFHNMGTYPYPAGKSFPLDDAHLNYLLNYNTRHMSGNEQRGYRFDYAGH